MANANWDDASAAWDSPDYTWDGSLISTSTTAVIESLKTGLLGCGSHSVFVTERGGGTRLLDVPFSTLSYGRRLDEVSDCTLDIPAANAIRTECCLILDELEPWQHEITVYRDGKEVWVGPVTDVTYTREGVTVAAKDLFQWFERRKIEGDFFPFEQDLVEIFTTYAQNAMARDDSPGIVMKTRECKVLGTRENIGARSRRAADDLRELARTGVDFTMVGRILYVAGDISDLIFPSGFPYFTDEAFLDISIVKNGGDTATEFTLYGDPGDDPDDPVRGISGGVHPDLGLVQLTDDDIDILDFGSAERGAAARVSLLSPSPRTLPATLAPDAPIDFEDLWAGIVIPVAVEVGCSQYIGDVRVLDVNVTAGEDGSEEVTVNLVPAGQLQIGS